jgi:hypothetical protein
MKYILLLNTDPALGVEEGTPEFDEEMAQWGAIMGELTESGALITAMGLDDDASATTLRRRDGERIVTDGPFAETKESLFSFIVIDVEDLDAAMAWAEKMPSVDYGSVEVRPLSPHEQDS